jgi:hypothetical protein
MTCGSAGFRRVHERPSVARRGLSVLEVLGCIVAVLVGVGAGAAYLGVDLLALVGMGMEKEVASPDEDPSGERPAGGGAADEASENPPSPGDATLAFWNQLREIIREEQQVRAAGEQEAGGNRRAVLFAHSQAYLLAAQNIRRIPAQSVDAEATMLAEEIAVWYDRGAELADEGSLLDDGELSSAQGPIGRRWHTSREQHRAELDLLSRKCGSLRGKLTARYRLHFAELR